MPKKKHVVKLAYCEFEHLYLRPNTLYKFIIIDGCESCAAKFKEYEDAHADPIAL